MNERTRRLPKRLLAPMGAMLVMMAFLAPGAKAGLEVEHYGGSVLGAYQWNTSEWEVGMIGHVAEGEGSRMVCQKVSRLWSGTESRTCGNGTAGNGLNQEAWWGEPMYPVIENWTNSPQRVHGYVWHKYNELGYFSQTGSGFTSRWSGKLMPGQDIESANGKFRFEMQTDGNAVVYNNWTGQYCWHTNTVGHPGSYAWMQPDGNFVIYGAGVGYGGGPSWFNTGTNGHGASVMRMQNDGNLVIYKAGGGVSWASSFVTGKLGC